ncbi:MAG: hypothetical protein WBN31_02550 [Gammaproteobacteria bacterium]
MNSKRMVIALLTVASLMLAPMAAFSADEPESNLARMWVVKPKPGMDQELEDAMKAHNAWRVENKDPWGWNTYHQVTGDSLDLWFIRSGGHSYADLDAYGDSEFSKNAYAHWLETVDPYVASYQGHLAEFAPDVSNWPADAGPYKWYWVYTYQLKPGTGRPFTAALKAITDALKAAGWDQVYAFNWQLNGEVPAMSLAIPEKDWGGFAGPENGAYDTVAKAVGKDEADAMWAAMFEHVKRVTSTVYHRHEDMSYEGAGN